MSSFCVPISAFQTSNCLTVAIFFLSPAIQTKTMLHKKMLEIWSNSPMPLVRSSAEMVVHCAGNNPKDIPRASNPCHATILCPTLKDNPFPKVRVCFANFPYQICKVHAPDLLTNAGVPLVWGDMDFTYSYSIVPRGTPAFETRSVPWGEETHISNMYI